MHGSQILNRPNLAPKNLLISRLLRLVFKGMKENTQGPAASRTRAPTAPAVYTPLCLRCPRKVSCIMWSLTKTLQGCGNQSRAPKSCAVGSRLKRIKGGGESYIRASRFLPVSHRIDRLMLTSSASRMRPHILRRRGRTSVGLHAS